MNCVTMPRTGVIPRDKCRIIPTPADITQIATHGFYKQANSNEVTKWRKTIVCLEAV